MREFLRATGAAATVLMVYFGYMFLGGPEHAIAPGLAGSAALAKKPDIRDDELRDTSALMQLVEEYRQNKGSYPVLPSLDVSTDELKRMLSGSGISFHLPITFSASDQDNRYVSVDGRSYGLLVRVDHSGHTVKCLVEINTARTGWWKQPPPCPI